MPKTEEVVFLDSENNESINLGGNIELVGFREIDGGSMIILKKMIGHHVRKMSDFSGTFEKISISMKKIGSSDHKFEVVAKAFANGKPYGCEVTDFNLFVTVDKALTKVQNTIEHDMGDKQK